MFKLFRSLGVLLLLIPVAASSGSAHFAGQRPQVLVEDLSATLDRTTMNGLQSLGEEAAARIVRLLGFSETHLVRIRIDPDIRVPFTADPASDGSIAIQIPLGRVRQNDLRNSKMALYHELTHALASGGDHGDRLLTEGLGVYVEDRMGAPNYPDFEQTPDEVVRALQAKLGMSIPLAESETARRGRPTGDERRLAYAQEGSFVSWLIATYGMRRFLAFYRSDQSYEAGLGKPLTKLEAEWRGALAAAEKS